MKILFLILLVALVSCGLKPEYRKGVNIHPNAQPYILSFENHFNQRISNLELSFKEFDSGSRILGYCQTGVGRPRIVINNFYWNHVLDEAEKEQLINHELGHCVLGRGHRDGVNGAIVSIMNTYSFSSVTYRNRYAELIGELFGNALAFEGLTFKDSDYTNVASTFPEYVENEFELLSESELHDCVGEKHDHIGEEDSHEHDEHTEHTHYITEQSY